MRSEVWLWVVDASAPIITSWIVGATAGFRCAAAVINEKAEAGFAAEIVAWLELACVHEWTAGQTGESEG